MRSSLHYLCNCALLQAVVQYHQWSTMSAKEVQQLQKDLAELEKGLTISDSTQHLRTELTNIRNKVLREFFLHYTCTIELKYLFFVIFITICCSFKWNWSWKVTKQFFSSNFGNSVNLGILYIHVFYNIIILVITKISNARRNFWHEDIWTKNLNRNCDISDTCNREEPTRKGWGMWSSWRIYWFVNMVLHSLMISYSLSLS